MEAAFLIVGLVGGGLITWLVTHRYYRRQIEDQEQTYRRLQSDLAQVEARIIDALVARKIIVREREPEARGITRMLAALGGPAQSIDVDGDGEEELLLEGPAGAHGSKLKILKWDLAGMDFSELGELMTDAGGFEIGDLDRDGRVEIATLELDYDAGSNLPYAAIPRIRVTYRWDGQAFKEINRTRLG